MLEEWQFEGENLRQISLTSKEKQVVLGSLLGNSSIIKPKKSKNPHFQMRESITKGGNWIRCKAHELRRFSRAKSFVQDKDSFRWNSISNSCWKSMYNLCYKGNKKQVTMQWLDQLQDYGLAVWFMDKGELRDRSLYIRVSRYDKKSVETMVEYFSIIGIPVEVKKFGGSKILHFGQESKTKFLKLVSHRFPLYYIQQIS